MQNKVIYISNLILRRKVFSKVSPLSWAFNSLSLARELLLQLFRNLHCFWITKVRLSFSWDFFFQILENTKQKDTFLACFVKTLAFLRGSGFPKNIFRKKELLETCCSQNWHRYKIFGPFFRIFWTC